MTIDLSTVARRIQPVAVLASVNKLLKRIETERRSRWPRSTRRSMNG